ncbi:MAG: histidine phosphatase family protein, partial [Candidatus Riflebacteria bacterium]|nr:histidine phosphatase family protein [Candidatus Riflebacteria bacterium]
TRKGRQQALAAGAALKEIVGADTVRAYVSPYTRTRQTYELLKEALGPAIVLAQEEPRLREQDRGNFQDRKEMKRGRRARAAFGHFFFRFSHGESGADVCDRVSTFLETLHRDFDQPDYPANALLVTHGLTLRLFLMRWFHWTVEYFESLKNPGLCEFRVLTLGPDGSYDLDRPMRQVKSF